MATGETLPAPLDHPPQSTAKSASSVTAAAAEAPGTGGRPPAGMKRLLLRKSLLPVERGAASSSGAKRIGGLGRSHSLTVADWAGRWKEAFGMFDRDMDGLVSAEELARELPRLGVNAVDGDIQLLLAQWDRDGKGALTLLEFTNLMNSRRLYEGRRPPAAADTGAGNTEDLLELKAAFDIFDRDGDGALSREEVRAALELIGEDASEADLSAVMLEADTGCTGSVSFREFCELLGGAVGGGGSGIGGWSFGFPGKSRYRPRLGGDPVG